MGLTNRQKAFLDAYFENPFLSMTAHAKALGIPRETVYYWKKTNYNGFRDEMEAKLAERWNEAKYEASEAMFNLMRQGDYKASKYILDYSGYAPVNKQEISSNDIKINIVGNE